MDRRRDDAAERLTVTARLGTWPTDDRSAAEIVAAQNEDQRDNPDLAAGFASEPNVESFLLWVTAHVAGEESVGPIPCWIVDLDAGVPWRLWTSKSQDVPPVQRIRIHQANGNVVMWEPLERSAASASPLR
jgi:hypothetical protein